MILVAALLGLEQVWASVHHVAFIGLAWYSCVFFGLIMLSVFYGTSQRSARLSNMSYYAALWIVTLVAAGILTYIFATIGFPLCDEQLARFDQFIGFDWLYFYHFFQTQKVSSLVLLVAYYSALPQIMFSIIFLSHIGRHDRNNELWWTSLTSLIFTSVLSGCFPAAGTFYHYSTGLPNAVHLPDLFALRNASTSEFIFANMQGIVTFPSYHTIMALLAIYVYRNTSIFWCIVTLNVLMLIATPIYGGHYLVDMIGGALVAALSIHLYRRSCTQPSPNRRAVGASPSAI